MVRDFAAVGGRKEEQCKIRERRKRRKVQK